MLFFSEKLNPPINISVSLENRSIQIYWKPPPTIGSASSKCFFYEVKITDHKVIIFLTKVMHLNCITAIKIGHHLNLMELKVKETLKKSQGLSWIIQFFFFFLVKNGKSTGFLKFFRVMLALKWIGCFFPFHLEFESYISIA